MTDKRILITGGGTGGHLYPAMAVIEDLRKCYPHASIFFIGSRKGAGRRLITEMGIEFYTVRARGLASQGNLIKKAKGYIMFLADLIPGFFRSLSILRSKKIDMVLGMGGYICAPVLLAAMTLGTRFALHEQNMIPGRLNRLFSTDAKYFFTSFKDTRKYLKGKKKNAVFSGNPVRERVRNAAALVPDYRSWGLSDKKFTVTAFGGSLGARKINESIIELGKCRELAGKVQVLLITGERFYSDVERQIKKSRGQGNIVIKVFPYIDNIEEVYRITDLVICRAGANTIFETAAAGIPSILVPYPFAVDDHQSYNARYMEKQGISVLIEEKELKPGMLADTIIELLKSGGKIYSRMKDAGLKYTSIDSAGIISEKLMGD